MALNGVFCADVLLRNYSLTRSVSMLQALMLWGKKFGGSKFQFSDNDRRDTVAQNLNILTKFALKYSQKGVSCQI